MAKSNKQVIEREVKELQKLISWCEYYTAIDNPIEANKAQKEIEEQKRKIAELRKALGISHSRRIVDFDTARRKRNERCHSCCFSRREKITMSPAELQSWAEQQLEILGLKAGDPGYSEAKQAAEAGWPAKRIQTLLAPPTTDTDAR